jgi:hypothetical protein
MRRREFLAAAAAALAVRATRAATGPQPQPGALGAGDYLVTASLPLGSYTGVGPATRLVCAPELDNLFIGSGSLRLSNLALVGNGSGRSYASGFAALVRDGSIELDGVSLENFRSSYWVLGHRSQLSARNVTAFSRPGNALNGAAINEQSCVLAVNDGVLDADACRLECAYLKGGVALYGASTGRVARTLIHEAGTSAEIADNAGAYAILAYAIDDRRPTLTVTDCSIDGARSCGIYAARALRVEVRGTRFARITDRIDGTLPKAAIALVASPDFALSGNSFDACYKKIVATTPTSRREIAPE